MRLAVYALCKRLPNSAKNERKPNCAHVATESVASVKAPLIARELLKVGATIEGPTRLQCRSATSGLKKMQVRYDGSFEVVSGKGNRLSVSVWVDRSTSAFTYPPSYYRPVTLYMSSVSSSPLPVPRVTNLTLCIRPHPDLVRPCTIAFSGQSV